MNEDLIFGIHAVGNAIDAGQIEEVWILQATTNKRLQKLKQQLNNQAIPVHQVDNKTLNERCRQRHQGVIARLQAQPIPGEKQLKQQLQSRQGSQNSLMLLLDNIEDPRNLGACLRSADAAGVTAVICSKNSSAPITAVARKTAAGAADHLQIYQVSNLARCIDQIKQAGIWVYGMDCDPSSNSIYQTDLTGAAAIVVGNEGKGLRHLIKQKCDHLINIPMLGTVQSLNVSVAAAIALFESRRQRLKSKP